MKLIKEKYLKMDILDIQKHIIDIKHTFQKALRKQLNLHRVSAPLVVTLESGLQDNLSGQERTVGFDVKKDGHYLEIVQSLAKWKRLALKKYDFQVGSGLYTDMTAIRRDDKMDQTHSIYVDQWDWEKVICNEQRNIEYLKETVRLIVKAIKITSSKIQKKSLYSFPKINGKCKFISSQELLDLYPNKSDKEREYEIVKKYKTVFIMGIGENLSNGIPHDMRAPDYDDWSLNGDLLFYNEVLDDAIEISSMGIRVDKKSLLEQLEKSNKNERLNLQYHKDIVNGFLPLTIGGGIGQSRLCMLLLGRAHIGEVQASYWDKETISECEKYQIKLL